MIDSKDYINKLSTAADVFFKISEKAFRKTEIDIVYSEIINWERAGLIDYDNQEKKGDWKIITYREYTWLKVINYLKDYGFSNNEILILKEKIFMPVPVEDSFTIVEMLAENYKGTDYEEYIDKIVMFSKENNHELKSNISIFDSLIIKSIIENEMLSILVSKDLDFEILPLSVSTLKDISFLEQSDMYNEMFSSAYVNIPISSIVSKYLIKQDEKESFLFKSILSEEEYELLKLIRKNKSELKSMNIIYNNGKVDRIELTKLKQVELESRLIDLIKKGDYLDINIVTQDGNVVKYENKEKVKF